MCATNDHVSLRDEIELALIEGSVHAFWQMVSARHALVLWLLLFDCLLLNRRLLRDASVCYSCRYSAYIDKIKTNM